MHAPMRLPRAITFDLTNPLPFSNLFPAVGTEFLYPTKAYYCDLCAKFLYTTQQTEMHLRSDKHLSLYKVGYFLWVLRLLFDAFALSPIVHRNMPQRIQTMSRI